MKSPVSAAIAIALGLIVLGGYFLDIPVLQSLRAELVTWAMVLAAFAVWIGVINLLSVHWKKAAAHAPDAPYSIILMVSFALTVIFGFLDTGLSATPQTQQIVNSIQLPIQASLMALLAFTLAYASIRLLRRRRDPVSIVFLIAVVVFLILGSGLLPSFNLPVLNDLVATLNRLPLAGSRGILLGVALGALTTGLRIIIGADRPYAG